MSPVLKAAREQGLPRYFTGVPCKHGHICERLTINYNCVECCIILREKTSAKRVATATAWYKAHTDQAKATRLARDRAKPAKTRGYSAARRALKKEQRCDCCTIEDLFVFFDTKWLGEFDVDHRVPLALGGLHCIKNLQVLTPEQHAQKTTIDLRLIAQVKKGKLSREAAVRYTESR